MCLDFSVEHPFFSLRALPANTLTHSTLDWILGDKGRVHWSLILGPSRTRKADDWISKGVEMASQSMNQGNGLNFAIKCMLNCQHVILCNWILINWYQSKHDWHLSCNFRLIFWFPVSCCGSNFFFGILFLVWCWFSVFKLDCCWKLVENIVWIKTHHFIWFLEVVWWDFEN